MSKPKDVPKGRIPESFTKSIIKDVKKRWDTMRLTSPVFWIDYRADEDMSYGVGAFIQDDTLYWLLDADSPRFPKQAIGGGYLRFQSRPFRLLREVRAGILKEHRGKGLYPFVLKALRRSFRRPLVSDLSLSASNQRSWAKVGVYDDEMRRFRINPTRASVADQVRVSWLLTEGRVPKGGRW